MSQQKGRDMGSEIGDRIREARERLGMKPADLARATGLSPGAISRIEAGERVPGGATLRRLAQALGLDVGLLLSGPSPPPKLSLVASGGQHEADGKVLEAIQMVARVMPTLPPGGQARVLKIIEAALG